MIGYSKDQQIGKVKPTQTQKNVKANTKLDKVYKDKKMYYQCELRIAKDCLPKEIRSFGQDLKMTYAHRHKRDWYKENNRGWLLSEFKQTIRCCIPCHMKIEADSELTEVMFKKLRPGK